MDLWFAAMGLMRRWYLKRELERATQVLGQLRLGEQVVTTQTSYLLVRPHGPVEGVMALTTMRLGYASAGGRGWRLVLELDDIEDVETRRGPGFGRVWFDIIDKDEMVVSSVTGVDFSTIVMFAVRTVQDGRPIDDPAALIRAALTHLGR